MSRTEEKNRIFRAKIMKKFLVKGTEIQIVRGKCAPYTTKVIKLNDYSNGDYYTVSVEHEGKKKCISPYNIHIKEGNLGSPSSLEKEFRNTGMKLLYKKVLKINSILEELIIKHDTGRIFENEEMVENINIIIDNIFDYTASIIGCNEYGTFDKLVDLLLELEYKDKLYETSSRRNAIEYIKLLKLIELEMMVY